MLTDPTLKDFPLRLNGHAAKLAWVEEIAETLWGEVEDLLTPILNSEINKYPTIPMSTSPGWSRCTGQEWTPIKASELGDCIVLDIESHERDRWIPTLACATNGVDWFTWLPKDPEVFELVEIEQGTLIIGHNASEHDSQFVSSEYLPPDPYKNGYIDTRSLGDLCCGVCPDAYAAFIKFKEQAGKKKGVPEWARQCTETNLAALASHLLGSQFDKSVQGHLFTGVKSPQNFQQYCLQDVLITLKIFQRLYPLARGVNAKSNIFWYSRLEVTGLRTLVDGWDVFLGWALEEYEKVKSIAPQSRTPGQAKLMTWGKTHLTHFKAASVVNSILPFRFNPSSFTGEYRSDLASWWINGNGFWEPSKWFEQSDFEYPLILGAANTDIAEKLVTYEVPQLKLESYFLDTQLKKRESVALRNQVPGGCQTDDQRKSWIKAISETERMSIFITLMSAYIQEYELDAWLLFPGKRKCVYAFNGSSSAYLMLNACASKAIRIAKDIL